MLSTQQVKENPIWPIQKTDPFDPLTHDPSIPIVYSADQTESADLSETRADPTDFVGDPGLRQGLVGSVWWNLDFTQHSAGRITTDSRIPEHCHTCNCTVYRNICYWHWTLFFQLILHVDVVLCNCSNSRISDPGGGYLNPCVWNVRHLAIRHSLRCTSLSDACLNGRVISAL